jgi:hypothetical protein
METHIRLELVSILKRYQPASPDRYPITPGNTVRELLASLKIPEFEVNIVFVDGIKGTLDSVLSGGERVGLFPPLGGG